jgi:ribosomal protein S7
MKKNGTCKYNTFIKAVGLTALTGILAAGIPQSAIHAEGQTGSAKASASAASKQLNSSSIQKAEDKLKELTGKSFTLGNATSTPTGWILPIQGASGGEVIIGKNGGIESISVGLKWSDLNVSEQEAMQKAMDTVFPAGSAKADTVSLRIDYTDINPKVKNKLQMFTEVNKTTIVVTDGKFDYANGALNTKDVPAAALTAAKSVIAKIDSVKKAEALTQAFLITRPDSVQYELRFGGQTSQYPVSVDIDKKTNKATGLYLGYLEDQYGNKSGAEINKLMAKLKNADMNKLKKTAVPQIKKWLGMDLSGYKLVKAANEPGNAVFTKSGAPSITITYNSKGELYWVN